MISKLIVLTFTVTMMSMFGISYCCIYCNDIELPFPHESHSNYQERTGSLHPDRKVKPQHYSYVQRHYDELIEEIKDYTILEFIYSVLPDDDDFIADFMNKLTSLGNCGYGIQIQIIMRIDQVLKSNPITSYDNDSDLTNDKVQEVTFLADCLTMSDSQGRIMDIFLNVYYGNRISLNPEVDCKHDLKGYTHFPGKPETFVFHFGQPVDVDRRSQISDSYQGGIHGEGDSMYERQTNEGDAYGHEQSNCEGDDHEGCEEDQDSYQRESSIKKFLRGIKHVFKTEHCRKSDGYKRLDVKRHLNTLSKIEHQSQKYSEWFENLKSTDPLIGESYFSYVVRCLRRMRTPLPRELIPQYYGWKYALSNNFHIWPENDATFIMYYLLNCPVGESKHNHYHEHENDDDSYYERSHQMMDTEYQCQEGQEGNCEHNY